MKYVAITNVPGYLPDDDEPMIFDSPGSAWHYLATEREGHEDDLCLDAEEYSDTVRELAEMALAAWAEPQDPQNINSVWGPTPGYTGDHDLGLNYSVTYYTEEY